MSQRRSKKDLSLTTEQLMLLTAKQKNGKPDYGTVLRYYRLQAGLKAWEVASLYSEALSQELAEEDSRQITANWIYMMENQNMVPIDKKRRWLLARILDIPPLLLGLEGADEVLPVQVKQVLQWERVDVVEYQATLERYCTSWGAGKCYEAVRDIRRRIDNLFNVCSTTRAPEKKSFLRLLCEYHILAAEVAHDQQWVDGAVELLSKAIFIAKENQFFDIWAYALRQRGGVSLEKGETAHRLANMSAAQHNFDMAVRDFDEARSLISRLPPQRKGLLLLVAGKAYAHIARDGRELKEALKVIDEGGDEISKTIEDRTIPSKLDEERYHLDKGTAYIASLYKKACFPQEALRELELAETLTKPAFRTRHAYNAIYQAEAYFTGEMYPIAIACAEQAIEIIQEIHSNKYLARLEALYSNVRKSPFGNDTSVAQLGIKLLRLQQPSLFV